VSDPWSEDPEYGWQPVLHDDFADQAAVDTEDDRRAERDEQREIDGPSIDPADYAPPACDACGDRDPFCCDGRAEAKQATPEAKAAR
jgi:hypothetical protein